MPPDGRSPREPIGDAMEWVSRIVTVAAVMVLPGLGGQWLDGRWGTKFVGLLGFAAGVSLGIWYLILITRPNPRGSNTLGKGRDSQPNEDSPNKESQPNERDADRRD